MAFRRPPSSLTSLLRQRSGLAASRSAGRQSWHQIRSRGYASGGAHGHETKSSDVPWAITSAVATAGICYYIGLYQPHASDHGHGHDEHAEEASSNDSGEKEEASSDSGSDSGDDQATPDSSDDESSKEEKSDK